MGSDVVAEASRWPKGVMTAGLAAAAGRDVSLDLERAKADGALISLAGLWLTPSVWEACQAGLVAALDALHAAEPKAVGWPAEAIADRAGLEWNAEACWRAGLRLVEAKKFRLVGGSQFASRSFRPELGARQEALLVRVVEELGRHGLDTPSAKEVAEAIHVPRQAVEQILETGLATGDVLAVGDFYVPAALQTEIQNRTAELFARRPFSLADWRDAMGTSRRVALAWLDDWDLRHLTVRDGDLRRLADEI